MAKIQDFMMGADPEFCICKGEEVIRGGQILTEKDSFGYDGNGITFEARPNPETNPLQIVNNIHGLFQKQTLQNPEFLKYEWYAGSHQFGYPLGGHIHFGIKNSKIKIREACNILSQYVGAITLLLEDETQAKSRRSGSGYGGMEDSRDQPYGFEYRTPSSWLTCPYIAAGVLCLAKAVMFEVLNNEKFSNPNRIQPYHFSETKISEVEEMFPKIWAEITKFKLYQPFKVYIDHLFFIINAGLTNKTKKRTWFPVNSMKQAWGIVDLGEIANKKLQLSTIWYRYINSQKFTVYNN